MILSYSLRSPLAMYHVTFSRPNVSRNYSGFIVNPFRRMRPAHTTFGRVAVSTPSRRRSFPAEFYRLDSDLIAESCGYISLVISGPEWTSVSRRYPGKISGASGGGSATVNGIGNRICRFLYLFTPALPKIAQIKPNWSIRPSPDGPRAPG